MLLMAVHIERNEGEKIKKFILACKNNETCKCVCDNALKHVHSSPAIVSRSLKQMFFSVVVFKTFPV